MIETKKQLEEYLEKDRIALGKNAARPKIFGDEIWKFQRALRNLEFRRNSQSTLWGRMLRFFYEYRVHHLSLLCGFSIPCNVFGPGLCIVHRGTIVINSKVRIGANCRVHVCVNIGASGGDPDAVPSLGENIYIGPGAKIFGKISIADGCVIGANAVVNRSVFEEDITIAGVPARKISENSSSASTAAAANYM